VVAQWFHEGIWNKP